MSPCAAPQLLRTCQPGLRSRSQTTSRRAGREGRRQNDRPSASPGPDLDQIAGRSTDGRGGRGTNAAAAACGCPPGAAAPSCMRPSSSSHDQVATMPRRVRLARPGGRDLGGARCEPVRPVQHEGADAGLVDAGEGPSATPISGGEGGRQTRRSVMVVTSGSAAGERAHAALPVDERAGLLHRGGDGETTSAELGDGGVAQLERDQERYPRQGLTGRAGSGRSAGSIPRPRDRSMRPP